jgi:hypothetical protein
MRSWRSAGRIMTGSSENQITSEIVERAFRRSRSPVLDDTKRFYRALVSPTSAMSIAR